jgi:hypothetical protein
MVIIVFWNSWSLREVDWTMPRFVLALSGPGTLYYVANTLIPDAPSIVKSWREYYFSIRTRLFLGLGLWAVLTATSSTLVLEMPIVHPARIAQITILGIAIIGITSERPRIHATLAIAMLTAIAIFGLSIFLNPDALVEANG